MRLGEYLAAHQLTDAEFGAQCRPPIYRTKIHSYRTGRSRPSGENARRIVDATDGVVSYDDLFRAPRRRAATTTKHRHRVRRVNPTHSEGA